MTKRIIALTGEAGAGKSTLAQMIVDNAPKTIKISTGQLVREYTERHAEFLGSSPLWMQMGDLAPEGLVRDLTDAQLINNVAADTIIIDGMPRIADQVDWLVETCERGGRDLTIIFMTAGEEAKDRVSKRGRQGDEYNDIRSAKDTIRLKKVRERISKAFLGNLMGETDFPIDVRFVSTNGVQAEDLAANLVRLLGIE